MDKPRIAWDHTYPGLAKETFPVISESEQKEIGRKYKALLEKHSHLTSLLTKQVELLMELKSSIVAQAVSFGILADLHPKEES